MRMGFGDRRVGNSQTCHDGLRIEGVRARRAMDSLVAHRVEMTFLQLRLRHREVLAIHAREPSVMPAVSGGQTMRPASLIQKACGPLTKLYSSAVR
jgi:hypothetical protein